MSFLNTFDSPKTKLKMKKIFRSLFLLTISLSLTLSSYAQLADGSVAPDFTATDLNGTSWHLYDLLNQGKTVYIDISATWCSPCWAYHNTGKLDDLYNTCGPAGTDEVMVFFVEGDAATTNADLNGTGSNTQGDWVSTTDFPILDNAGIATSYQISYFPTIYKICPNRIITEIGQTPTTAQMQAMAYQCPVATYPKDVSCLDYTGTIATCSDVSMKLKIQNMGTDPLTSANITAKIGATTVGTLAWTGNLATYDLQEVTVGTTSITSNSTIDFTVTTTGDANSSNGTASKLVNFAPIGNSQIVVHIVTDRYGDETTWKIKNDANQVFGTGGPYNTMSANGESDQGFSTVIVPSFGCYYFEINDAFGDGMCCSYGNGTYEVKDATGVLYGSGSEFTNMETRPMKVTSISGINDFAGAGDAFSIFPNPANNTATISFNLLHASETFITVTDMIGKIMFVEKVGKLDSGYQSYDLDLSKFSAGVYQVSIQSNGTSVSKKFTVIK